MVKILNTSSNNNLFFNTEQYNDCSSFLMKADDPPLEELDPAILSCGLPAIVLSDMPTRAADAFRPKIRYTPGQLQAMRKSALCFRRPVVADDPRIGQFAIWKSANQLKRSGRPNYALGRPTTEPKGGNGDDMKQQQQQQPLQHEKPLGGGNGHQKFHYGRENGFVGPRFRRNYDFNNRNHHVIVKNYRGGGGNGVDEHHYRLQDTVIEEEPEWMAAGPTSRLDTIELRGFDEDTVGGSPEKATSEGGGQQKPKHISFYDELHHYEHIVNQKKGGAANTSSGDVESVATSNGSSPPPARSTPTKSVADCNNNVEDEKMKLNQQHPNGVNVNNFEEFMKFDSLLGSDSSNGSQSRFSKWFRRGSNGFNQSNGQNFRQAFLSNNDAFGNNRFAHQNQNQQQQQRHFGQQQQHAGYGNRFNHSESFEGHFAGTDESNNAFKRLVDMVAQNRASNNNLLAQQQYLMQLLNKNQQSEILRRMLMKNAVDNVADANQQQPTNQTPRIPTQQELQFHTQSIMQNALLRKKLQDQRKMLYEQAAEPNPAVQQFVQSVCPNMQRSLSVLSQTATSGANQFAAPSPTSQFASPAGGPNSMFPGGSTATELSNSLQQMLLSQPQQQRPAGSARRFGKGSVTWNLN